MNAMMWQIVSAKGVDGQALSPEALAKLIDDATALRKEDLEKDLKRRRQGEEVDEDVTMPIPVPLRGAAAGRV